MNALDACWEAVMVTGKQCSDDNDYRCVRYKAPVTFLTSVSA